MSIATNHSDVLDEDDLREVDRRLLSYLQEGRVTPAYARTRLEAEDVGEYSRGYVQQRLSRLAEHGHATNKEGGLYELVDDPREDAASDDVEKSTVPIEEYERLQERVEELEQQLEACREQLDEEPRTDGGVDPDVVAGAAADIRAHPAADESDRLQNVIERLEDEVNDT